MMFIALPCAKACMYHQLRQFPHAETRPPLISRQRCSQALIARGTSIGRGNGRRSSRLLCSAEKKSIFSKLHYSVTELDKEIAVLALPALASLAADPVAGLVDTAYIGKLGSVELAAVGVALSAFNTVTKIFNVPLLAVTTSLVATAEGSSQSIKRERARGTGEASSAALIIAFAVGIIQAGGLFFFGNSLLSAWGAAAGSELRLDAAAYLRVKALGAPATVLLLVLQGIFRGLGDTKTPFVATVMANAFNVLLDPILIFVLGWGAPGAALATVFSQSPQLFVSQLIAVLGLLIALSQRANLSFAAAQAIGRAAEFLGPTGLLAFRSIAISGTFAVATSMSARTDSAHAAAHQICFQLWLASSLLADALAVAAQSIMARNLAAENRPEARLVADKIVSLGLWLGITTGIMLAAAQGPIPRLFTPDRSVLSAVSVVFPWVIVTQPITALAFVWDGVLYGVKGFKYAAKAMVACALPSVGVMILALLTPGQPETQINFIWAGLALVMTMRTLTIYLPYKSQSSPFQDLYHRRN